MENTCCKNWNFESGNLFDEWSVYVLERMFYYDRIGNTRDKGIETRARSSR